MYNLIIDLEMCNVPRDYRRKSYKYANETIQIGAVLLDENFKRISTLCQYVHPEYGVIDYFIESLTGIRNSQVKNAPRMQEALLHMIDWLGEREYISPEHDGRILAEKVLERVRKDTLLVSIMHVNTLADKVYRLKKESAHLDLFDLK